MIKREAKISPPFQVEIFFLIDSYTSLGVLFCFLCNATIIHYPHSATAPDPILILCSYMRVIWFQIDDTVYRIRRAFNVTVEEKLTEVEMSHEMRASSLEYFYRTYIYIIA